MSGFALTLETSPSEPIYGGQLVNSVDKKQIFVFKMRLTFLAALSVPAVMTRTFVRLVTDTAVHAWLAADCYNDKKEKSIKHFEAFG